MKQRKAFAKWPDINSRFTVLSSETEESISTTFCVFQGLMFYFCGVISAMIEGLMLSIIYVSKV